MCAQGPRKHRAKQVTCSTRNVAAPIRPMIRGRMNVLSYHPEVGHPAVQEGPPTDPCAHSAA
eukprot:4220500-Alexandrium_andersonii.AAC.1